MKGLRFIVMLLMIIGSLNWGLIGVFQYDLLSDLFGGMSSGLARFVYSLVGLAGIFGIAMLCNCCKCCHCGKANCSCKK